MYTPLARAHLVAIVPSLVQRHEMLEVAVVDLMDPLTCHPAESSDIAERVAVAAEEIEKLGMREPDLTAVAAVCLPMLTQLSLP